MNNSYEELGKSIGALVDDKQKSYGNSFGKVHEILLVLYPNGIPTDHYRHVLAMVRILDKMFRIATDPDAFGENPYRDIAGYGMLGVGLDESDHYTR